MQLTTQAANAEPHRHGPYASFLIPFDGTWQPTLALRIAAELAAANGVARITLMAVAARSRLTAVPGAVAALPQTNADLVAVAERMLDEHSTTLCAYARCGSVARAGWFTQEVVERIKLVRHDLVVLGPARESPFAGLRIAYLARTIVHRASVPVLLLRNGCEPLMFLPGPGRER
jgi:nucleotide-binding universal stress UspA family protein